MAKSELIGLHFGLGMWIRNNLGLWKGNDELMQAIRERDQAIHPDDVSPACVRHIEYGSIRRMLRW